MMKMRLFIVAMLLCVALPVRAQDDRQGHPSIEKIEQWKKVRLIEALNLTEEKSARLVSRISEHDKARRGLFRDRAAVLDRLEELTKAAADEKEYVKIFAEIRQVDVKMIEQSQKFFDGLKDLLTDEQRAKYLVFERQFDRQLREAFREMARPRGQGQHPERQ